MIEIGRICVKSTGREAGRKAVIVDILDKNFVIIDGNVKRRKCNINHIEILPEKFDIKKGATTEEVKKLFREKGILVERKPKVADKKPRKGGEKPKKIRPRKKKEAPKKAAKGKKKSGKEKNKSEEEIVEEALKAAEKQESN